MTGTIVYNASEAVAVVQPGFNTVGIADRAQMLTESPKMEMFDAETQTLLKRKASFTLVLGQGFETEDVSAGLISAPCRGLASTEQLRFLKDRGLTRILMARPHPTLIQNARAVGIEVITAGLV